MLPSNVTTIYCLWACVSSSSSCPIDLAHVTDRDGHDSSQRMTLCLRSKSIVKDRPQVIFVENVSCDFETGAK